MMQYSVLSGPPRSHERRGHIWVLIPWRSLERFTSHGRAVALEQGIELPGFVRDGGQRDRWRDRQCWHRNRISQPGLIVDLEHVSDRHSILLMLSSPRCSRRGSRKGHLS